MTIYPLSDIEIYQNHSTLIINQERTLYMPKYEIETHFNGKRIVYNDYLESASKVISACISCIENPSFDTEEFEDLLTLVKMFRNKVNFECSLEPDKEEDKNKAKRFWNNLIRLKCVHEESIQGHTGETLRYFLVDAEKAKSPSAKPRNGACLRFKG